ncbi:hypothetical protein C8R44DRAFT_730403 [Mycena epipterygia]|nr:hypothetical protein C8R44DRAFT_730403 [Mycena epipterygia]
MATLLNYPSFLGLSPRPLPSIVSLYLFYLLNPLEDLERYWYTEKVTAKATGDTKIDQLRVSSRTEVEKTNEWINIWVLEREVVNFGTQGEPGLREREDDARENQRPGAPSMQMILNKGEWAGPRESAKQARQRARCTFIQHGKVEQKAEARSPLYGIQVEAVFLKSGVAG